MYLAVSEPVPDSTAVPGIVLVRRDSWLFVVGLACLFSCSQAVVAGRLLPPAFFAKNCFDCHADGAAEGGLDLRRLKTDLNDPATFAVWEKVYDRIERQEMPPRDATQPSATDRSAFLQVLRRQLTESHAKRKGTVLRRLNRREYENTLNDLFGTNLDLAGLLPEDGKSHEFDNVGEALGLSMVHLRQYMEAIDVVLDAAIANTTKRPETKRIVASYANTAEAERFVGKVWKKLKDGAVVRFSSGGYPSGMMRGSGVRTPGRYRVKVTGYAHQSKQPITFSVGGTSFARGSEKPIYGFWTFPPGRPGQTSSIEFETWIEQNYMIAIEPTGISDPDRYRRKSIAQYSGPGLAILQVTLEGPLVEAWPLPGHQLIFSGIQRESTGKQQWVKVGRRRVRQDVFKITSNNETDDAKNALTRVATAAFRRPVKAIEVQRYVKLFAQQRANGEDFEAALKTAVAAIFCSPRFLYFQENDGRLDSYQLANRLSYFLTRTMPDQKLLQSAASGELSEQSVLREHVERLLSDKRFERFLVDFTDTWLDLASIDFTIPDRKLFPEFDPYLRYSMPLETREFVRELIAANRPVVNLVKSEFAMLNGRLAAHYDLPGVAGAKVRKVKLANNSYRGGLLSQASILKVTANGTNTSPVTRGAWVMERILGEPPPPPPPGIPGVEPDIRGTSTLRELLDKHRNVASCRACHQKIDPPGFALETFNPIGGYREHYRSIGNGDRVNTMVNGRRVSYRRGPAVDSSGQLDGKLPFQDFREFQSHLAANPRRLATAFVSKLLTFATGRELGFSDRDEVQKIVALAAKGGYRIRDLLHLAIQSPLFRNK